MKSFNMLELFKGTGSVGKVGEKDFNIVSLDSNEKSNATITTDILEWDYKKFFEETNFIPDFIWASPPCNSYSILAYTRKERDIKTAEPLSDRATIGTNILYQTLDIIEFFQSKNPNLLFVVENPRGMMRLDKRIKLLKEHLTLYCLYEDLRMKPTNFFSNFDLNLKSKKECNHTSHPKTAYLKLEERYMIPPKLIENILDDFFKTTSKNAIHDKAIQDGI